jgi:transcriptional/translational regulatory protein YebC/TACO1
MIAILALAAVLAVSAAYVAASNSYSPKVNAAQPAEPHASISVEDTITASKTADDQAAMLERGNTAMGFDQYKIMHHFMATQTGGQIMIVALGSNDNETISQIKSHIVDIQLEFSQGNFTKPFFIHAQDVPGTKVMAEKKNLIKYSIKELDNGATLVLTTDDSELLQAIQQFMEFQGSEHHGH